MFKVLLSSKRLIVRLMAVNFHSDGLEALFAAAAEIEISLAEQGSKTHSLPVASGDRAPPTHTPDVATLLRGMSESFTSQLHVIGRQLSSLSERVDSVERNPPHLVSTPEPAVLTPSRSQPLWCDRP